MHPKETLSLRLALGSILAPKRPYTPSSRSSSGTASPAQPASFISTTTPLPPPPPHSTPTSEMGKSESFLHPARAMHHPHTPSRLGMSDPPSDHHSSYSPPGSAVSSSNGSPTHTPVTSLGTLPSQEHPLPLKPSTSGTADQFQERPVRPGLSVMQPTTSPNLNAASGPHDGSAHRSVSSGSGSGTPKAKFFETLGSKQAWEALIHGSFS